MARHSQLGGVETELDRVYRREIDVVKRKRKVRSEQQKAEKKRNLTQEAAAVIRKRQMFYYICGRKFAAFPECMNEFTWKRNKMAKDLTKYKDIFVQRVRKNGQCNNEPEV